MEIEQKFLAEKNKVGKLIEMGKADAEELKRVEEELKKEQKKLEKKKIEDEIKLALEREKQRERERINGLIQLVNAQLNQLNRRVNDRIKQKSKTKANTLRRDLHNIQGTVDRLKRERVDDAGMKKVIQNLPNHINGLDRRINDIAGEEAAAERYAPPAPGSQPLYVPNRPIHVNPAPEMQPPVHFNNAGAQPFRFPPQNFAQVHIAQAVPFPPWPGQPQVAIRIRAPAPRYQPVIRTPPEPRQTRAAAAAAAAQQEGRASRKRGKNAPNTPTTKRQ